jgi:dTDP-4-amino-4,6-dideoxygalactose transaminase
MANPMQLKRQVESLAIFGGEPAFRRPLHVGRPHLGSRDAFIRRINGIFDRVWLTNSGPCEEEFERQLAAFLGVRHVVAMCNATIALAVLARALRLQGEVLLPAFTFVATAHALEWQGLRPVFCDIDPATHNIDPQSVEAQITSRTSAIVGVHVWGRPCPVAALTRLARAHNLALVFDAAHAFGATLEQRPLGGCGNAEVFSFHATKLVNAFEGGAVTTNDDDLAAALRAMRNFGFVGYDQVDRLGINAKLTEGAAAMGLTSLESVEEFVAINRKQYHTYRDRLATIPGIKVVEYDERERCNYQYVPVEIDSAAAGLSRDEIQTTLIAENVLARRYFYPGCHQMVPYVGRSHAALPVTDRLISRILCLPSGSGVDTNAVETIADIVRTASQHAATVRENLALKHLKG